MSTEADIVTPEMLRALVTSDHKRGCQGREYGCSCGYDDDKDAMIERAAVALEQLSAERDAAARALRPFADVVGDLHERAENDDNIWESPAAMNLTAGHLREALYVLSMLPESDAPAGPVIATDGKDAT